MYVAALSSPSVVPDQDDNTEGTEPPSEIFNNNFFDNGVYLAHNSMSFKYNG